MAAFDTSACELAPSRLLCLKCRGSGHQVNQCPQGHWISEFSWFFSDARRIFKSDASASASAPSLPCTRCKDLNILHLLHEDIPWKTVQDFENAVRTRSRLIMNLGKTGTIKFDGGCTLCRCLFALTPNPASEDQDILVFPNFSIYRVTGEKGAAMDRDEKRKYAKCLLVALEPSLLNLGAFIQAHRGDALCLLEDPSTHSTLGGRLIDIRTNGLEIMTEWLSLCSNLHGPECLPVFTEELKGIRLIDVENRVVIEFPETQVAYAALSYVWGPIKQPSFALGAKIKDVPKTIEDAMTCVKMLKLKYLWVDSICIEQSNEALKLDQINRMYSIYRGATITLIALSGTSVDAGLPRMSSERAIHSQLQCTIGGTRLVGLMPTLSNLIWTQAWGSRAWTLQEGILSPRCLYFSDHGLYFECAAMQCCETLDQKRSWAHNLTPLSGPSKEAFTSFVLDETGTGCLRNPLDSPEQRLTHWGAKLTLYCYRKMSHDSDALNAFKGVQQRLEEYYPQGFFWGLPVEDFQWGLLWWAQHPPVRRHNFPTWSWLGWKTALWHAAPQDVTKTRQFGVDVRIWKFSSNGPEPLFETSYRPIDSLITNDLLQHVKSQEKDASIPSIDNSAYAEAEGNGYILLEAVSLDLTPDFSRPGQKTPQHGKYARYVIAIDDVRCFLFLIGTDPEIHRMSRDEETAYLLLARDRVEGWVCHYLLVVYIRGAVAVRGTVMVVLVPDQRLDVLGHLKPKMLRLILA